jgi:hypothetical protein
MQLCNIRPLTRVLRGNAACSYGWSLDCSWLDVTGIPAGDYILKITVNPERRIAEQSYTNNQICIKVRACVHVCMCACVRACVHARARACVLIIAIKDT